VATPAAIRAAPETLRHALLRNPDGSSAGPLGAVLDMVAAG